MGVDSSAVLVRWLTDPSSRDFDLGRLTVIVALTGDEFPNTIELSSRFILPRLARAGVRLVQVARGGLRERDGIIVLDDSRHPKVLYPRGPWALSDELLLAGTVPTQAQGMRRCSQKWKGWPIDYWLSQELGGNPYRHVMGYHAKEQHRAARDRSFGTSSRHPEYPLLAWGWDKASCEQYLFDRLGVWWPKSACVYCPFAASRESRPKLLERWRAYPDTAVLAINIEITALALNPHLGGLFGARRAIDLVRADGNHAALERWESYLRRCGYVMYEVRRVLEARADAPQQRGRTWRSVTTVAVRGTEGELLALLRARVAGRPIRSHEHTHRVELRPRGAALPTVEHALVVAPEGVQDKAMPGFWAAWQRVLNPHTLPIQPSLFDETEQRPS